MLAPAAERERYADPVTVRRRRFFLFTHASSLFSFWAPAAGSTLDDFGQVFRQHATDTLRDSHVAGVSARLPDVPTVSGCATASCASFRGAVSAVTPERRIDR